MELLCFFGFGGSLSQKVRALLQNRSTEALRCGMELVDQPAIFKDVINGKKFQNKMVSDVNDLSVERRNLETLVVCNRTFFGSSDEIFSSQGDFYPFASRRAKYFAHALQKFPKTIVLELDVFAAFFLRFNSDRFRMSVDSLSRTQLLDLSWNPVIHGVVDELHNARLILVSTHEASRSVREILNVSSEKFSRIASQSDIDDCGPVNYGVLPERILRDCGVSFSDLNSGIASDVESERVDRFYNEMAYHSGTHRSIVREMTRNYFEDIEKLKHSRLSNVITRFL